MPEMKKQKGEERREFPPTMMRSRGQLASVYAPGALFTFEGNLGACKSISAEVGRVTPSHNTREQIIEQISELVGQWWSVASTGKSELRRYKHDVLPEQAVDNSLIVGNQVKVGADKFAFVEATKMGYVPFPLSFICRNCGLHRSCRDVNNGDRDIENFKKACPDGPNRCADNWEQLDVVFAHWSGSVEPLTSIYRKWDSVQNRIKEQSSCTCGNDKFKLRRNGSYFSQWYFECTNPKCQSRRAIEIRDAYTLRLLGNKLDTGDALGIEFYMEPVSYRASATYYPQSDKLLDFEEYKYFELLGRSKAAPLQDFLAKQYEYPIKALTDQEKEEILRRKERGKEWDNYVKLKRTIQKAVTLGLENEDVEPIITQVTMLEETWNREVFSQASQGGGALAMQIASRVDWIRRFDPIRMAVEHRTLLEEKLRKTKHEEGKFPAVRVTDPDLHMVPDGMSEDERAEMVAQVQRRLDLLGIEDMRLVRNLGVCEYSFGYSRTSSSPLVVRNRGTGDVAMPVRLRLFDRIRFGEGQAKHPIYTMMQKNEAFYVRIREDAVLRWLEENDIPVPKPMACGRLGGFLIESYPSFSRFLLEYRKERSVQRAAYPYVYTLLHTMAHQFIEIASELSGLDLGSFGEHMFVPDLAFLVYRRGTTMDLGNLSSMWRNHGDVTTGNLVVHKMAHPESLRCGSESVCSMRGGACPDCILIPETSCITRNELLSRSVLVGSGLPLWDDNGDEPLRKGFYEVTRDMVFSIPPDGATTLAAE